MPKDLLVKCVGEGSHPVILILADSTDPWAILIYREARRSGAEVRWVEPAHLLDRVVLNWPVEAESVIVRGSLAIDDTIIPLSDLTGVFSRLTLPLPLQLGELSPEDRDYVVKESTAAWLAILNALPCAVVNRPVLGGRPVVLSGSPFLSRLAEEQGIRLPSSRCTSNPADATLQFSTWRERVYVKRLGSEEPGLYLSAQGGIEQIRRVMETSAISMQAVPDGRRMTVYVAGHDVAASVVRCNERQGTETEVPSLLNRPCLDLVRRLGLSFAECQCVLTAEGAVYCLDVSPRPSYWHCPQELQQEIVRRLVGYLSEMRSLTFHDSLSGADGRSGARERLR